MPISEAPADVNEPNKPPVADPAAGEEQRSLEQGSPVSTEETRPPSAPVVRGSRWVDYDTHELLEMISELEDERRWARLREGVLWAILVHLAILAAMFPVAQVCPRSARSGQNHEARQGRVHVHGHAEVSAEDRAEARDQAADDRQTDAGRDEEASSASPGAAASAAAGSTTAACARSAPACATCPADPAIAG